MQCLYNLFLLEIIKVFTILVFINRVMLILNNNRFFPSSVLDMNFEYFKLECNAIPEVSNLIALLLLFLLLTNLEK